MRYLSAAPARAPICSVFEQSEQLAERVAIFQRVPQVSVGHDRVVVTPSNAFMGEATRSLKLGDNSLHRALSDTDKIRYLALADIRVATDR